MSRRRNNTQTLPAPTPPSTEPAPAQGVTLNLRNPDVLRGEWDAEARKSEDGATQDRETANRLRAEASEHQRQAGQAAEDEMRLMEALNEARQRREHHDAQKDAKLSEGQKFADRAQFHEDRAADLRASIETLLHATGNGNGQVTSTVLDLDPTETSRIDGALSRIDAAHAELPADQRDEGNL